MVWTNDLRPVVIEYHPVGTDPAAYIAGVANQRIVANSEIAREIPADSLFPETASVTAVRPVASFTTWNITQAIDNLGLGGPDSCIEGDGTHPGLTFWFNTRECGGPSSNNFDKYVMREGIIVPRILTVDHRANAQITYDMFVRWDGTNDPVVETRAVATGPTVPADTARWTMQVMTFNSVAVEGKRNITINFNPTITREGADSEEFDTVVALANMLQQIQVRGVEPDWFEAVVADTGTASAVQANNSIVLRKRNTADATAEHILLNFSGIGNWDTIVEGTPDSPAQAAFNVELHQGSGQEDPIVANTAYAIP